MSTTSYYLYQKYISVDGGEPTPAYPAEYSYDGEGTMPPVVKEQYDSACGQEDTYRWVDTDDFICEETYSSQYLTIESLENGNIIEWKNGNGNFPCTISASTDNGTTWTAYTSTSGGTPIASLNAGQKVLLKGLNERYFPVPPQYGYSNLDGNYFITTKTFNIYGNIMSLISGDTFENATSVSSHAFHFLFQGRNVNSLVSAENLVLPATTLADHCYSNMFLYCRNLITPPKVLPATTLAEFCYASMFDGCINLTTIPELPAATLARRCYTGMFRGCTSLTITPELPVTTLAEGCYIQMFMDCTSLTTAPVLPATTLTEWCYYQMFINCSNLASITCLATNKSASLCTREWVKGVASTGTFVKAANASWATGDSGIPDNWTVQNA